MLIRYVIISFFLRHIIYSLQFVMSLWATKELLRMKIVLYYRVASVYVFEISSILVLYRSAESMHK